MIGSFRWWPAYLGAAYAGGSGTVNPGTARLPVGGLLLFFLFLRLCRSDLPDGHRGPIIASAAARW